MKNNKKLLNSIAILLLVAMIALALISGTYAKYTTSATGSDSARVARWGFDSVSLTSIELFATSYDGSVLSGDSDNVIAPGTTKSATLTFAPAASAAPEVAYSFDVTVEISDGSEGTVDSNLLAKLQFKLDSGSWLSFDDFQDAVEALGSDRIEAGNFPGGAATHTIAWQWAFEGTGDDAAKTAYDTSDTALGNAETLANLQLDFTVGATQID